MMLPSLSAQYRDQVIALSPQTLEQIQATGGCRWPEGDPKQPGFGFCGAAREASELPFSADPEPYCALHRDRGRSHARRALIQVNGEIVIARTQREMTPA